MTSLPSTTDNQVIKLRLVTFVGLILATISMSFTVGGIIFSSKAQGEDIENLDNRITKTTGRNAKAIEKNTEDIQTLKEDYYLFKIQILEDKIKERKDE